MNKTTFTINTETFDILDVSKKGYNFGGWYDSENFETANKIERIEKGTTKNLTLYAKWDIITYIITYETYDSSVDNSLNVKSYTIISDTFELKNLNRDGYKFEGWYDGEDSDKANKITEITKGSAKNYNLYAKWKVITYTISYEKYYDDVDNSVNRNSYNITTDTFEILSISKPGYEFKGWYDSENFETANKVERIEKGSTKNYTLYAKWDIITYTINYETYDLAVDNSLNIKSYTIVTDTFDLKDLNRDGYKFEGWYDGEDFDKSNKITKIIKGSTQNYNLYAKWKVITYTISYEKYYDDVDNSMNKNSYNITTETFELFSMSKKGYEFKGWYDSENFETANKVERIEKGSTKNYTLFANWVVISYTISYVTKDNITDGTLSEDVKITYTIEESFELEKPSCIGYMFVDWYDDKELENRGNVVKTISKGTIGDKTFYARWTDEFDHEGYRRIDSTDDFIKYRDTPVYYTDNARLYSRITLQYYLTEGVKWTPIGDSSNPFSAIFDGNGYDIIQFYLQSGEKYTSIFGTVKNATIKNLYVQVSGHILSNVAVKGAGLVYSLEDSIIENCAIEQDVLPSTIKNAPPNSFTYGGICYSMKGDSVISNSYYAGKIDVTVSTTLGATVGGLVVHMEGGKIINSYSNAYILITSTNNKKVSIGGLVGNMKDGEIINSFATGNIKSTSDISNLGGLVGIMTKGTITNCFATGDIYAPKSPETSLVGNLIGSNTEGVLDNCYGCVGQIIEGYTINNGSEKTFDELVEFTNEYYDSEIWVLRETELPYLKCFKVYYSAVEFNYTTSEGEQRKYYSVPIEEFNTRIGKYFDMFYSEVSMEELNSREKYQFIDFYYNNMPWSVERNVVNQGIYFEANYYYKFF
ncbi:MAG: InlB B-repeat-containing protein, partial [Clostridia bacterium]|nr:InlB B-repeat-containing protein [Clostridia bacterium]